MNSLYNGRLKLCAKDTNSFVTFKFLSLIQIIATPPTIIHDFIKPKKGNWTLPFEASEKPCKQSTD